MDEGWMDYAWQQKAETAYRVQHTGDCAQAARRQGPRATGKATDLLQPLQSREVAAQLGYQKLERSQGKWTCTSESTDRTGPNKKRAGGVGAQGKCHEGRRLCSGGVRATWKHLRNVVATKVAMKRTRLQNYGNFAMQKTHLCQAARRERLHAQ
jgi:hypothetical protein